MHTLPYTSANSRVRSRAKNRGSRTAAYDAEDRRALQRWSNEGGHCPADPKIRGGPIIFASSAGQKSLKDQVDRMSSALAADFANGLVGTHYNTFQHRSRVLRQMTATLNAMSDGPRELRIAPFSSDLVALDCDGN
jgi:hypothetical protein